MIRISSGYRNLLWYGVAWEGTDLVATAVGESREDAENVASHCIPAGVGFQTVTEPDTFADGIITMLHQLEAGIEENKQFSLSQYISAPQRRILSVAAAIPIGFVSTYGNIARTAGSEARAVGRTMATNPLYPIVPCHRVVGSDMSLIGYGGKQDERALKAKLGRLEAEKKSKTDKQDIPVLGSLLTVYPVERVIEASRIADERRIHAAKAEREREEAEKMQLRLF